MACNVQGSPGICTFVPGGRRAARADRLPRVGRVHLRPRRHLRRQRRLPQPRRGNGVQGRARARTRAVVGVNVCDGQGRCKAGPGDDLRAVQLRSGDERLRGRPAGPTRDCVSGVACVNGSCGPKPRGRRVHARTATARPGSAPTASAATSPAAAPCVSCNQVGPRRHVLAGRRAATTIRTQICQRQGSRLVRADRRLRRRRRLLAVRGRDDLRRAVVQRRPPEHGRHLQRRRRLPPAGRAATARPTAAATAPASPAAPATPTASPARSAQNGSCGPKPNGQPCAAAGECMQQLLRRRRLLRRRLRRRLPQLRAAVVDGPLHAASRRAPPIRATSASTRARPAAAPTASATAPPAAARTTPGTICAAERCDEQRLHAARDVQRDRPCVAPDATRLRPVRVQRRALLHGVHGRRATALPGKVCIDNSCGLKPNGAFCADKRECASGNCAQGVCCATGCASACKSCALPASMGLCTNVPDGQPDPTGDLPATAAPPAAAATASARRAPARATRRGRRARPRPARRARRRSRPPAAATARGRARSPAATSCFPFRCGAAACKSTCTADADCAPPGVCSDGSCGLKPDGAVCGDGSECASGICAQGICCKTACAGSLHVVRAAGQRRHLHAGRRRAAAIRPASAAIRARPAARSNGFCDGAGGCQLYAAGTQCAPPTCPAGTTHRDAGAHLRRRRHVRAGRRRQSCAPYTCNGTSLPGGLRRSTATASAGMVCNGGSCGKKRLGQICARGRRVRQRQLRRRRLLLVGELRDLHVVQRGRVGAGACKPGPGGRDGAARRLHRPPRPADSTAPATAAARAGRCRRAPAAARRRAADRRRRRSAPATAPGAAGRRPVSCAPYLCGTSACKTTCATTADCVAGYTCQGYSCTNLEAERHRVHGARRNASAATAPRAICCGVGRLRELQLVRGRRQAGNVFADRRRHRVRRRALRRRRTA